MIPKIIITINWHDATPGGENEVQDTMDYTEDNELIKETIATLLSKTDLADRYKGDFKIEPQYQGYYIYNSSYYDGMLTLAEVSLTYVSQVGSKYFELSEVEVNVKK